MIHAPSAWVQPADHQPQYRYRATAWEAAQAGDCDRVIDGAALQAWTCAQIEAAMISPYRDQIAIAATNYGLDPLLVEAVVWQESSGQADAFRHEPEYWRRYCAGKAQYKSEEPRRIASSYGLMQIMYPTAYGIGFRGEPEELFGIPTNLDIGCRLLKSLLARAQGEVRAALAMYNGGPGAALAAVPLRYADQVLARYHQLQANALTSPKPATG